MRKIGLILSVILTIAITQSCSKDDYHQENFETEQIQSKFGRDRFPDRNSDFSCDTPIIYYIKYDGNYTAEERDLLEQHIEKEFATSVIRRVPTSCNTKESWIFCSPLLLNNENEEGDSNDNGVGGDIGDSADDGGIDNDISTDEIPEEIVVRLNRLSLTIHTNEIKFRFVPCTN
ncbi:hypothetical protein [Aquimarina sp. MMG016]|uniref:hypothetical protein n=1 Tax=Aquimarina sp. MMG016 TaxID=2822690 RepID=UPI001B3A42AA|nr:hypothetical protein [Aquimarina sp. MMG016]MBQ4822251.1 hypothetical protein [Aquimarina sp. MMG016]